MALSTALSDLFLALSSFHSMYTVNRASSTAQVAFLIIGCAASLGTLKFGLEAPGPHITRAHRTFSWLATVLGMSLLSAAYCQKINQTRIGHVFIAFSIALISLQTLFAPHLLEVLSEVISSLAVVTILITCFVDFNSHGILGSAGYIIAGLAIGTQGTYRGIPAVDLFHYVLFLSNIALALGLSKQPTLYFYKKS
ncbi:uncharacterized protein LOC141901468 [Tubulanus polymorphus]|uniref:uncharacterized protein LOC141901468 n=1 Tax=Tubulanus polymorphus TaxID=672921 RepID=UPI003DA5E820